MLLFEQWRTLLENQTDDTLEEFWKEYSGAETVIYKDVLANKKTVISGVVSQLAASYDVRPVIFMGFLDGILTSLTNEIKLEEIDENSEISLHIDFAELFKNMLKADADYLYTLEEWMDIFDEEKQKELVDEYRRSRTVVKEAKIGRNEPCPCGSGKKYKKCCGK